MKRVVSVAGVMILLTMRAVCGPSPTPGVGAMLPVRLLSTISVAAPVAVQEVDTPSGMAHGHVLTSLVRNVTIEVLRHTERLLYPPSIALKRPGPVPPEHQEVQLYIDAATSRLDRRVRDAMRWIDGADRRVLALKYYIARHARIGSSWTWTLPQIVRFKKSAEYHAAIAEVEKVRATFATLNPGYTLQVNTEVRTVEEQIAIWNDTPSIHASGSRLLDECLELVEDSTFDAMPEDARVERFQSFLASSRVVVVPTVAVPGFSQHGQLRAFDFAVRQGDDIVAGTDAASIRAVWDNAGWTKKLAEAIRQSSNKFSGPLASPREPWHYTYIH